MRGKIVRPFALSVLLSIALVVPAQAGPVVPFRAHPYGHSYQQWLRLVGQFYLGDGSNPLIAGLGGDCGEQIDGVFFMAAPIDLGVEFSCQVPIGTPIVLSHAGFFATKGIDAETDAELSAIAAAGFEHTSDSLSVDGKAVPLRTISAGVFDVHSESGSFDDTILGAGTGVVRTALIGNVVVLHPLSPGDHTIETEVTFVGNGGAFSATYHVHVR